MLLSKLAEKITLERIQTVRHTDRADGSETILTGVQAQHAISRAAAHFGISLGELLRGGKRRVETSFSFYEIL